MIDSVVGHHANPFRSGVARFNEILARRLGVPVTALPDTGKGAHPLLSFKVGELDVFVGRNYVLSVRTGAEKGFPDVRARSEREPELLKNGASFVLYTLMDAAVDRYFPILHTFEIELEDIEERIFSGGSPRRNLKALYAL